MSANAKSKIIVALAVSLLALAAFLTVQLLVDENGSLFERELELEDITTQPPEIISADSSGGLTPYVTGKYLWEFGWQQISADKPIKAEKETTTAEETTTVREPETYVEYVTNWKGERVTNENGEYVTEIRTKPHTETVTVAVTKENGEVLTDANGNAVTQTQVVTTTLPPDYATDASGEIITDTNGNPVTKPTTTAATTAVVTNPSSSGAKQKAEGISDGEKFVRMKIYIDEEYNISKRSVMTLTLRQKGGVVSVPTTLTYNLYNETCNISPSKKYGEMCYVTKSGGKTIVTLIIPEESRPLVKNTTTLKASSTISTFKTSSGDGVDEFTVSVF